MDVLCLRVIKPQEDMLTLGAVSGSMLYLTSFASPTYGALLGIDLSKPDVEPTVRTCSLPYHHARPHVRENVTYVLQNVLEEELQAIQLIGSMQMHT